MTLHRLPPGTPFRPCGYLAPTFIRTADYHGLVLCQTLGVPRAATLLAPTLHCDPLERTRRAPSNDAGADVDPLTATQEHV
jgi:hypothetical protein